jgi:hypothetical protein
MFPIGMVLVQVEAFDAVVLISKDKEQVEPVANVAPVIEADVLAATAVSTGLPAQVLLILGESATTNALLPVGIGLVTCKAVSAIGLLLVTLTLSRETPPSPVLVGLKAAVVLRPDVTTSVFAAAACELLTPSLFWTAKAGNVIDHPPTGETTEEVNVTDTRHVPLFAGTVIELTSKDPARGTALIMVPAHVELTLGTAATVTLAGKLSANVVPVNGKAVGFVMVMESTEVFPWMIDAGDKFA